jgi:class 3 adenylate cyclase
MSSIAKTSPSRQRGRSTAPLNCSIFITDIVGYGDPRRHDHDRAILRATLLRVLTEAFAESGLAWRRCHHQDRGDGLLTIVPPTLSTSLLIDPLLPLLGDSIRRHNHGATDQLQMRLRSALHVGPVLLGGTGYPNASVIHAARMLDSAPLRRSLATTGHAFATMVSSYVYENVVRHMHGALTADAFHRTWYQAKATPITSWMYVTPVADEGGSR